MADMLEKKRSRILTIQKNTLVQLVENYFVRSVGHHCNVNVNIIGSATWQKFANILNTLGPPKTETQWKNSFQCMCTRIRNKVALIRQLDANPVDNLSKLDFKIYQMLPTVDFETLNNPLFYDNETPLENDSRDVDVQNAENIQTNEQERQEDNELYHENEISLEGGSHNMDIQNAGHSSQTNEFLGYEEFQEDNALFHNNEVEEAPGREVDIKNEEPTFQTNWYLDYEELQRDNEPSRTVVIEDEEELKMHTDEVIIIDDSEDSENYLYETNQQPFTTTPKLTKNLATSSPSVQPVKDGKINSKIPDLQKERLVQLIQNNFFKAFGRFAGSHGVAIKSKLWGNVAKELNKLGPARTADQWKTTFNGIKASAKAKLADSHNNDNGMVGKPLNRLEEKIVAIYGLDSLDGEQRLGEVGFKYKHTVPVARSVNNPRNNSTASLERSELPRPASSEEDEVLRELLTDIQNETDGVGATLEFQHETEREEPPTSSAVNPIRNTNSKSRVTSTAERRSRQFQEDVTPRSTNERNSVENVSERLPQNSRGSFTRANLSTIALSSDGNNVIGRSGGRSIHDRTARVRNSTFARLDDEDGQPLARQSRDRSNLRNRYTSYDMVQSSIQQQELFIEQNGRNHAEMMHATDRNHSEMIGMFTSTLKTFGEIVRDVFNKP